MKKYITYLLATALVGSAFVSCSKQIQEGEMRHPTHKVHFSASDVETRTGLSIDGTTVTPDWKKTALENIHLFEIDATEATAYGETIAITTSEDYATAHFEADFPTDMSIIVDPSGSEGGGSKGATKGTRVSPYKYAAIIAQKPDKNNYTFVVPAEQHPDAETLKDPDADFLIGYSRKAYDTEHFFDEPVVDLYFDRVAALGRLAISQFSEDDGMVKSVTINAQNGLTGSASYADIDFENGKVNFVREEGPGSIALVYDGGMDIPADGPFYAYFVAIPGSVTITSVEVVTDHYRYTKTIDGGKELTFSEKAFKSMNLDLSTATREEVAPSGLTWYKASVLEDGIDYLIVSQGQALKNNDGATAAVSVTDNEGVITLEAADPTIVWTATAKTYTTGDNGEGGIVAGHFTLTNNGYYLRRQSNTDILLDTTIPSDKPKYVVWDYDGSYLKHESSETATFFCFYNNGWSTGYTSNGAAPGSDIKTVQIYTSRAPQELVFTPAASAEYDLATSEWVVAVPTLSGVQTSVTYALSEDSNPAVATVDADGTVHPLSMGTVTIVATAAGDAQYQAATASYTLRIINSNIQATRYILTSTLEAGKNYLVVSGGQALKNNGGNVASYAVTPADGVIEIESGMETDLVWTSKAESGYTANGHFSLSNGGYRMNRVSNSGNFSLSLVDAASAMDKYGVWDLQSYNGNTYLFHDSSTTMRLWVYYDGGWKVTYVQNSTNPTSTEKPTQLYVEDDGRLPQTPSFSPKEINYDMAGSAALVKPTLSNAIGDVTYSSSNEAIATVDSNSGDVTVKKVGTVEITASAAGNSQYKPGSASYTLVITNSSSTTPIWYKADAIEAGETYLIVSNGYVLENNGGSAAAIAVDVSNGVIEFDAPASALFTATASSGNFTLQNNGQYMQRGGSSGSYVPTFSSSQGSYYQWTYDSAGEFVTAKGNSTYYVYYSTGNSKWSMNTSGGDSHKTALYKLGDGSNPGGGDDPGVDPGEGQYYVLVTSEPASWNGKYLIVNTAADGTGSAMNGTGTANVTISGGKILSTSTIDGYALTVTSAGEIHPNQTDSSQGLIAYDITFSDGDWLYWYSSKYKQTSENQSTRHNKCTLFYDNGGVRLMSAGYNVDLSGQPLSSTPSKNYLYYQTSGSYTMSSSHSSDRVQLYKLDDGGTTPGGGDDPQPPTPSTTTYSRVSFATGITTGKYLIVNPADAQVFTTVTSYPNSASVTPSSGVISGDYVSYEVTITKSGDNYTIQNASGQYLYYVYTSGDTETRVAYKSDTENWAASSVSSDANGFDLNCSGGSGRQHIYWNNSSAGTFFKIGSQTSGVHLYKKADP